MTAPIPRDIPDLPAIPGMPVPLESFVPASAVVTPTRRPAAAAFRLLVALVAAGAVGVELLLGNPLQVLSHFSIQTGVLVTVVLAISASRAWTARRPLPPLVTGGTLLYVLIAALVYHVVLTRGSSVFIITGTEAGPGAGTVTATDGVTPPTGWHALTNPLLHTVIPLAAAADWLLLTRPGPLRPAYAATWMLYPLAYLTCTLTRGAVLPDGSPAPYVYPFLNVDQHGYKSVLANALLLGLAFYALALFLVAVDHLRPNPVRHRHHRRGRRSRRPRRDRLLKTGFRLQPPVG
ncbi:Pr6Pr family membrane protein [Streptomyces phyllanthi]|uniref:Integral membrane regulator n=1 Tax=Streptomyces phyllanthi TaxID=1803180 RepID=A0A5N8VXQ0_9ACTN|nr:Pr6Pr family membrane protein [Streptomyces phyllanthi]MPY39709.1 integral membrane regulator [Streptomyces phyllanthi]